MAALTAERDTPRRDGVQFEHPVAASSKIFAGAIVMINGSGYAVKGAVATSQQVAGVAEATADNTSGAAGDIRVKVRRGVFRLLNSTAGDLIALADKNSTCYIVDDQTVAKTNGGSTRSAAGIVRDVDASGVWVEF